jgi:hypothetical protein
MRTDQKEADIQEIKLRTALWKKEWKLPNFCKEIPSATKIKTDVTEIIRKPRKVYQSLKDITWNYEILENVKVYITCSILFACV